MSDRPEFVFELLACEWAEREWPPGGPARPVVVGRQIGTRRRRWDTVVVEVDPAGLAARREFGERALDADLLDVVRHAPAEWRWYRDALPEPDYPWRHVREAVHRAADRDLVETRRDGNRIQLRRERPYPDWVERVIAIENKPDLDASAARALTGQLQRDVALGLADEVWLATTATGEPVEPALLEDLPPSVGILALDVDWGASGGRDTDGSAATDGPGAEAAQNVDDVGGAGGILASAPTADVLWHPRSLAVDEPGTRILERPSGDGRDRSAARFEYVDPSWKRDKRLALAERAYGRGWRSYLDRMRPDCRSFGLRRAGRALLPHCGAKGRCQTSGECSGDCPEFAPEPPAWRCGGWPIEGGPGRGVRELLERRRSRRRP